VCGSVVLANFPDFAQEIFRLEGRSKEIYILRQAGHFRGQFRNKNATDDRIVPSYDSYHFPPAEIHHVIPRNQEIDVVFRGTQESLKAVVRLERNVSATAPLNGCNNGQSPFMAPADYKYNHLCIVHKSSPVLAYS
jgi:hypothetical protein